MSEGNNKQPKLKPVTVTVNTKPVKLPDHKVTGLAIKQAAIDQGLEIELGFELTREGKNGKERKVADDETITVNEHDVFLCNSGEEDS